MTFKGTNDAFGLGENAGADGTDNLCSLASFGSFGEKLVVRMMKSSRSTIAG